MSLRHRRAPQRQRVAGGDHGRALMATLGMRPRRGAHVALAESGVKIGIANEAQMVRVLTKRERPCLAARAPRPPVRSSPVRIVDLQDDQKDSGNLYNNVLEQSNDNELN